MIFRTIRSTLGPLMALGVGIAVAGSIGCSTGASTAEMETEMEGGGEVESQTVELKVGDGDMKYYHDGNGIELKASKSCDGVMKISASNETTKESLSIEFKGQEGTFDCKAKGKIVYSKMTNYTANASQGLCSITVTSYGDKGEALKGKFSGTLIWAGALTETALEVKGGFNLERGADNPYCPK